MEQLNNGSVCDELPPLCAKYPWMVSQDDHTRSHIFYTMHDELFPYRCQIPELLGKRIRGFNHGWVILSNNVMWSLWNPSTSKLIHLPPLNIFKDGDSDDDIRHCCLSSPPDVPGSVILLTTTNKPTFVFCRLDCKIEKLKWMEVSYAKQLKKITIDGGLLHSLTCCNGKVYALSTGGSVANIVIHVDIVVEDKEVVIKLFLFGACPIPRYHNIHGVLFKNHFLKGSSTELFCIIVDFSEETKKTISAVTLLKLDTTSIKWEELEGLKDWDMTNISVEDVREEDHTNLDITGMMWEEMSDLKDAIFFVDLGRDCSVSYNPAISSQLGGYIHIRGQMDSIMYSYHVNYRTIVPSSMPSLVMSSSHVLMWEFGSEDDHREGKCTIDFKHEEDEMVVRSITRDEVGFSETLLLAIPFDVLERIMKLCVGVEYMNIRATCKQCRIAAPSIQWSNETALKRLKTYSLASPWLMVIELNRGILSFIDPMLGDNYFMKNSQVSIVEGSNSLYCSRFGWLLFESSESESSEFEFLVLFNPFANDLRKLPDCDYSLESLCISAPPTSPACMVVGFSRYDEWCVHIHHIAREPTWRTFHLGVDRNSIRFPTFYGQDLYALCNEGEVIVFKDLGEENYSGKLFKTKAPVSCCKSGALYYLMTCDQHLLLVIVGKYGESVEVFKQNDFSKEWEKLSDLGKHMIYICDTTCLCIDAQTPEMENKIYFPCLHPTNRKIVFYSLETGMFNTFNGKNIQEYLGGLSKTVRHHNLLAWIEPRWS